MHLALHRSRMRRIAALLGLAALSAVALVGLTRCNYVSDRVTAPRAEQAAQNCISGCAHQYNDSLRVESDLHVANVHACADDPVCLALEDARHDAAVDRIQEGRKACMENCHHQGGGNSR
jgi:hypothetical protein